MTFDFSNKTVLITGASRGIGRKTAEMFASAGANVIIHYLHNEKAAKSCLNALKPGNHHLLAAPLDTTIGIVSLAEKAIQMAGRIDLLINNAGIYEECDLTHEGMASWMSHWERTIQINLTASSHLSYLISNHMISMGGGKIINISSRGAFRGEPMAPAYAASKAGMNAFGQSLAKALAPHKVYVYMVAPGFVETEMSRAALDGPFGNDIRNQSPFGRVATTQDIAHAVLMLASDGNEFMTGTIVDVNGASYLR